MQNNTGARRSHSLLEEARRDLRRERVETDYLVRFVEVLPNLLDKSQLESSIAEFHNLAGRLPYWQDYDVGALILESVADSLSDGDEKKLFYRHALYRARWCASCASAGGEGLARMFHVTELQKKNA